MKLLAWPDRALRRKAEKADPASPRTAELASRMIETMENNGGIGLAATQVGVPLRVLVIGRIPDILEEPLVAVNPEITGGEGWIIEEEGCLSFPGGFLARVKRLGKITAFYHDLDGQRMRIEASGLLARVIQHEIDHLNGIVFPDRLTFARRRQFLRLYGRGKPARRVPGGTDQKRSEP